MIFLNISNKIRRKKKQEEQNEDGGKNMKIKETEVHII